MGWERKKKKLAYAGLILLALANIGLIVASADDPGWDTKMLWEMTDRHEQKKQENS